jgi:hypothetical protein
MKKYVFLNMVFIASLWCAPVFSQTETDANTIGLPGDNLNLYAVLDLFQQSKTIEEFEKALNTKETGINNLDLNLDEKVDFIKVETKQDGDNFSFILRDVINDKETQDVAVILVSKDKEGKVTLQIVGDVELYGKDYIVEPAPKTKPAVTANPAYAGTEPAVESAPATTTVVVVESAPIVQYVYSPVYVPYYPPPMPPPYFVAFSVIAISSYHNNYYHHGYPPYSHGNTVVIHNTNNYNNYNNNYRNTSNTVNHNKASGNYNRSQNNATNKGVNTPNNGGANRQNNPGVSNNASKAPNTRSTKASTPTRSTSPSATSRPSSGANRSATRSSGRSSRR